MESIAVVKATGLIKDCLSEITVIPSLRKISFLEELIRSLSIRINPQLIRFFFNKKKLKCLNSFDTVIILDVMGFTNIINSYIDIEKTQCHLVFRNIIDFWGGEVLKQIPKEVVVWTTDPSDAEKFGLKYCGQCVDVSQISGCRVSDIRQVDFPYDFYFAGVDKGRFKILESIKNQIGSSDRFIIRKVHPYRWIWDSQYQRPISYSDYLDEISKCKVIIELNQEKQRGLTVRTLESIILQKKLVTNNKDIINYSFYNPKNIFIITNDNISKLNEFLNVDFEPYSEVICQNYDVTNWLKNISQNIECKDRLIVR